ncbi:GNAT family N-acetyltransferase [Xanthobacter dioxanivorans]|uniref:GNAT family N-acetyltransferase n=1 Tax=Xanthobacter dioxanivorans TaxID=2528964 RepID=A0A974SGQ7_9HYPH|nr:GNAT family N-acetyltransferase [Xanthobacter dioxanivorans]QRG04945.1 GNAT family N-acetyltransferase [Xanthobacter dioxanivorans]
MSARLSLRPYLPADAPVLAALFRASILDLTGEDYDEEQQEAWAAAADDEAAFAARLAGQLTLVALKDGAPAGFVALKDNTHIDLLYVHPDAAGAGVARALCDAAEALAKGRGAKAVTVDASDTALGFFQKRGYEAHRRNMVPLADTWLGNTAMKKKLGDNDAVPRH